MMPSEARAQLQQKAFELAQDGVFQVFLQVTVLQAEKAYRRGDLFDKCRAMMLQWADWCTGSGVTDAEPEACAVGGPERPRNPVADAHSDPVHRHRDRQ